MKKQHNLEVKSQTFDEKKLEYMKKFCQDSGIQGYGGIVKIKENNPLNFLKF